MKKAPSTALSARQDGGASCRRRLPVSLYAAAPLPQHRQGDLRHHLCLHATNILSLKRLQKRMHAPPPACAPVLPTARNWRSRQRLPARNAVAIRWRWCA